MGTKTSVAVVLASAMAGFWMSKGRSDLDFIGNPLGVAVGAGVGMGVQTVRGKSKATGAAAGAVLSLGSIWARYAIARARIKAAAGG